MCIHYYFAFEQKNHCNHDWLLQTFPPAPDLYLGMDHQLWSWGKYQWTVSVVESTHLSSIENY